MRKQEKRVQTSQRKVRDSPIVFDHGSETVSAAVDEVKEKSNHRYRSSAGNDDKMPRQSDATGLPKKELQMAPVDVRSYKEGEGEGKAMVARKYDEMMSTTDVDRRNKDDAMTGFCVLLG
ncbi:MAG: hypothetical protein Q9202_000331 [Teloschistes flavicans]